MDMLGIRTVSDELLVVLGNLQQHFFLLIIISIIFYDKSLFEHFPYLLPLLLQLDHLLQVRLPILRCDIIHLTSQSPPNWGLHLDMLHGLPLVDLDGRVKAQRAQ